MRPPTELPPTLPSAFTYAQARAEGVSPRRLRHEGLYVPTRGVRASAPPTCVEERAAQLRAALPPDAAFSHVTAARLLGLWLPSRWTPTELVHVSRSAARPKIRRRGIVSHSVSGRRQVVKRQGMRVIAPADTWADLVGALDVDDLIVLADSTLRHRDAMTTLEELERALARVRGGRSKGQAALRLARPNSGSPMETRVRLVAMRAGLPEPELNGKVYVDGEYAGAFDLVWRDERVIVEYDGDQHRTDRDQWLRDRRRLRLVMEDGWKVVVLTADDVLRHPEETVRRLVAALSR